MLSHTREELEKYLKINLTEYEIISANFGWHIHEKDKYCGQLKYQETMGWQGTALSHLPPTLIEKLKNFTPLDDSLYTTKHCSDLPFVA